MGKLFNVWLDNNILPFDIVDTVDAMLVAAELFGVSKILEGADTRADDELVASVRELLPFCNIFDKVPFDAPTADFACTAVQKISDIYNTNR